MLIGPRVEPPPHTPPPPALLLPDPPPPPDPLLALPPPPSPWAAFEIGWNWKFKRWLALPPFPLPPFPRLLLVFPEEDGAGGSDDNMLLPLPPLPPPPFADRLPPPSAFLRPLGVVLAVSVAGSSPEEFPLSRLEPPPPPLPPPSKRPPPRPPPPCWGLAVNVDRLLLLPSLLLRPPLLWPPPLLDAGVFLALLSSADGEDFPWL